MIEHTTHQATYYWAITVDLLGNVTCGADLLMTRMQVNVSHKAKKDGISIGAGQRMYMGLHHLTFPMFLVVTETVRLQGKVG